MGPEVFPPGAFPWSAAATLVAALIGAGVAIWGIKTQRLIARTRATVDFIARSEADRDMIDARRTFNRLVAQTDGLLPLGAESARGTADVEQVRLLLNEFELIAIGIRRGIIDYDLYRRWYRAGALTVWREAEPLIMHIRRRTDNHRLYAEFEALKDRLARDNGKA